MEEAQEIEVDEATRGRKRRYPDGTKCGFCKTPGTNRRARSLKSRYVCCRHRLGCAVSTALRLPTGTSQRSIRFQKQWEVPSFSAEEMSAEHAMPTTLDSTRHSATSLTLPG